MIPYLGLNAALVVLWIFSRTKSVQRSKLCIGKHLLCSTKKEIQLFAVIIIAVFMGVRGAFTADHRSYMIMFSETVKRSLRDIIINRGYTETGWMVFNKFVSFFTHDANDFMLIEAVIFVVTIMTVVMQSGCNDYLLFDLMFVNAGIYFYSFNMVRQAFAACVVFAALKSLGQGNKIGYIILIFLATTIHTTAIVMLVALPFLLLRVDIRNALKYILIGIITLLLLNQIIEFVQRYRYSAYPYGMDPGTINAFLLQWTICVFILIAIYNKQIDIENRYNVILINSTYLYIIFSFATLRVWQMNRICYFFSTPMLLLASNVIGKWKGKSGKLLRLGIVAILVLYSYVWLSGTGYDPYYTFYS